VHVQTKPLKGTWHELLNNEVKKRGLKIYFIVDGWSKSLESK
jgi:hypothetical protein